MAGLGWSALLLVSDRLMLPESFSYPLLFFAVWNTVQSAWTYHTAVPGARMQSLWQSTVAGSSLTSSIALAVYQQLLGMRASFHVTPKQGSTSAPWWQALWRADFVLSGLYWLAAMAACVLWSVRYGAIHTEALLWAIAATVMVLPSLAAVRMISYRNPV